jgi:hypothetical protein
MRYLEEKQSRLLINSLKKTMQKPSLFALFKKNDEINIEQISKEIETTLKGKMDREVEGQVKEQMEEIQKLKEEKNRVNKLLQTEKEQFSSLQIEITKQETATIKGIT